MTPYSPLKVFPYSPLKVTPYSPLKVTPYSPLKGNKGLLQCSAVRWIADGSIRHRLDAGLQLGSRLGHGCIRHRVDAGRY